MMTVGMMAANGQITGAGPADPELKAARAALAGSLTRFEWVTNM